jgi:predicted dehydrogenase/nucleoside-diphosphate-sugar epimerase
MTNSNSTFRVALVGTGGISGHHIRGLRSLENVEIVGLSDLDQDRAQRVSAEWRIPNVCRDLAALSALRPDVVHILTPPASHAPLTIEALDRGFHVFVEKPMGVTVEECDRMIAKAKSAGRVLSVNHSARFDPPLLRALELVKKGAIGEVLAADYIRSSEYPPFAGGALPAYYRDGGYPFRDIGVHALYVIEAFLGEIQSVRAQHYGTGRHYHLMFDEWRAQVECRSGAGQIHLSWNSRPMQNTVVVQGTSGALVVDSFLQTCTLKRCLPGPKAISMVWNATMGTQLYMGQVMGTLARVATKRLAAGPDIQNSIRQFYAALAVGTPPPVLPEEGRRMVAWLETAARPADEERCRRRQLPPLLEKASILVTGGSGFLGTALLRSLATSGESVRVLARRAPLNEFASNPRISYLQGDLGQPEVVERAMEGIETVYHVGAAMNGWWEDYQAGTLHGTRNVAESARRHGVKKVVYVSSLSVLEYITLKTGQRVDETAALEREPQRRGFYTQSKLEAERIVVDAISRGLNAVIVRPGQIFGRGAEQFAPYGTISMAGRWFVMGNGKTELPLVYVDDVVDALILAAKTDAADGKIVQLVDPKSVNQREYVSFARRRDASLKVGYVPLPVLYTAALGLEILSKLLGRSVPLTFYRLRSLKSRLAFDCSAAKDLLGWFPRKGVRLGLEETFGRDRQRG